ncbi:early protein L2 [Saimiri sciureus papillomavirus 1]|uniref:Minor capsid protein L2 n=1 Tax=Saimiri sciureus papillomavirus 1 TaxID=990304 RepID=W5QK99_9PAPI|nr:early protein L2 [Saimiri sciureus papillomavirus 1]AEA35059.1 early protein L2 [Saimiri sciureus papillomavirus 1]
MTKARAHRRKRASATQIYQTCRAAGTCPSDVVNKIENTTIADRILQWGSLGVFFGNLGISTGAGTGGRTGYIPVGSRPPVAVEPTAVVKPPVVIETSLPAIEATDSSIVPLLEDANLVDIGGGAAPPSTGVYGGEGFHVTSTVDNTPAVLPIAPAAPGASSSVTDVTFYNPLFTEPAVLDVPTAAEAAGTLQSTVGTRSGSASETISLQTFTVNGADPYPSTSTPVRTVTRGLTGLRLYGRDTQQVRVDAPAFFTRPSQLVTYDNPVFDSEDTTLWFDHPPSASAPAPDPDFLDIVALHRPALTSRKGTVRYSRIGQRATLRTRSGKQIGARVHFYKDFSPIARVSTSEAYEMQPLVQYSSSAHGAEPLYDIFAAPDIDTPSVATSSTSLSRAFPTSAPSVPAFSYSPLDVPVAPGPDIVFPTAPTPVYPVPGLPYVPLAPPASVTVVSGDFVLHPSYFWKRRKRVSYFFADGVVAA